MYIHQKKPNIKGSYGHPRSKPDHTRRNCLGTYCLSSKKYHRPHYRGLADLPLLGCSKSLPILQMNQKRLFHLPSNIVLYSTSVGHPRTVLRRIRQGKPHTSK